MTDYRCDTGGCPQITYTGDTVTIVETANPEQVVVTSAAKWDAYLETVRAQERARIVAGLRTEAKGLLDEDFAELDAEAVTRVADMLERGEFDDLAAGDE